MSNQPVLDQARAYAESQFAGAGLMFPTGEPIIAQTDETIRQFIMDIACSYKLVELPNGEIRKEIDEVLYPELRSWQIVSGPLDSTTFFDEDQAQKYWFRTKLEIRKNKARFSRNPVVRDAVAKIQLMKYRQTFGDAEMGKKQEFVGKLSGADKILRFFRSDDKQSWWKR